MSNLIYPSLPGLRPNVRRAPVFSTKIKTSLSGRETRYRWETYPRYRYTLSYEFLRSAAALAEFQKLFGFISRHQGQLDSFLFTDSDDSTVTAHPFGVGDGATTTFQLQRTLVASTDLSGAATRAYWPTMGDGYEPVFDLNGNPSIFVDTGGGPVLKTLGVDYTLPGNGAVSFTAAPAANAILTWTASYYRRVRFDDDEIGAEGIVSLYWEAKTVPLISVKPLEALPTMVPPQFVVTPKSETPAGALNGTNGSDGNATFTLSHTPVTGYPVNGYRNGIRVTQGVDYTVAGATITAISPNIPITGDSWVFDYFYTV